MTIKHTREQELAAIEYLVFSVNADEVIEGPEFRDNLEIALSRPGTRDALITLLAGTHADCRVLFTGLMMLSHSVIEGATSEVRSNYWATAAALCYSVGMNEQAEAMLDGVEDDEHRMTQLLRQCIIAGVPGSSWAATLAQLSVEECLDFDRPAKV